MSWRESNGPSEGVPLAVLLLLPLVLLADSSGQPGLVYGDLLETDGSAGTGSLSVRDEQSRVIRCSYDSKTYVEIQKERGTVAELRPGDRLEVLTDRQP